MTGELSGRVALVTGAAVEGGPSRSSYITGEVLNVSGGWCMRA